MSKTEAQLMHDARAGELLTKLWNDGEIGAALRKKAKEAFPDVQTPEEAFTPVFAQYDKNLQELRETNAKLLERLDARDKKDREENDFRSLEQKVNQAVEAYSLTEDGRQKMLDRMKETGNTTDPEAAAAWVASKAPPAEVTGKPSWAPQAMNLFGSQEADERFAALHRNPEQYMDEELMRFQRNPDLYVQETLGTA